MKSTYKYIILAIVTFICWQILNEYPTFSDQWYRKGVYIPIRYIFHAFGKYLPFPLLYIFIIGIASLLFYNVYQLFLRKETSRLKRCFKGSIKFLATLYIAFNVIWGFNYTATTLPEHFAFSEHQPDSTLFLSTLADLTDSLTYFRKQISTDTFPLTNQHYTSDWSAKIHHQLPLTFKDNGHHFPIANRVRLLYPKGSLMRIGTAGFYMPFTGEGHVDAGMHIIKQPYTTAHELAHAYGITDEGECNFWAFLCTSHHSMPSTVKYSAYLAMWRYFMRSLYVYDKQRYYQILDQIDPSIINDINAIHKQSELYPDIIPYFRDWMYDHYLKSQGIEEGNLSYGKVSYYYLKWLTK